MWARHLELILGLWLAASPFVFGHATLPGRLWLQDLFAAVAMIGLSSSSHFSGFRRSHLALLPIAMVLVLHGWWRAVFGAVVLRPAVENWIVVGLCLGLLAVIPSQASRPPPAWGHGSGPGGSRGSDAPKGRLNTGSPTAGSPT